MKVEQIIAAAILCRAMLLEVYRALPTRRPQQEAPSTAPWLAENLGSMIRTESGRGPATSDPGKASDWVGRAPFTLHFHRACWG